MLSDGVRASRTVSFFPHEEPRHRPRTLLAVADGTYGTRGQALGLLQCVSEWHGAPMRAQQRVTQSIQNRAALPRASCMSWGPGPMFFSFYIL